MIREEVYRRFLGMNTERLTVSVTVANRPKNRTAQGTQNLYKMDR